MRSWSLGTLPGAKSGQDDTPRARTTASDGTGDRYRVFGRDPATGALDLRHALFGGVDVPFLDSASGPVLSPDGAHLYVVAGGDDAINAFAVR